MQPSLLAAERHSEERAEAPPRLILFLVVDQCRADYLERFRPLLRHGLKRLLDEGVSFNDFHHHHAISKTAPGHATLVTGVHPSRHGVISNRWFDPEEGKEIEAVDDSAYDGGVSPRTLLASTLGDWLKAAYPDAKVFGASAKDRSAILLVGKGADGAFWFDDESGHYETSSYYLEEEPGWLKAFNAPPNVDRYFGALWEPLPETREAIATYGLIEADRGLFTRAFPHSLGRASTAPDKYFYEAAYDWSPFMDSVLGDFAQLLIDKEQIGMDEVPDFLGLSFSSVDKVGHRFGPDSPELLDTLLRVDEVLGQLLDFVDRRIGLDRVIVSLSSDHGVNTMRGQVVPSGHTAHRLGNEEILCFQRVEAKLDEQLGEARWFDYSFHLDRATLAARDLDYSEVEGMARALIEKCPRVQRAWTRSELLSRSAATEPWGEYFVNTFHASRSPDFLIQLEKHTIAWTDLETTHGSVYEYDTHIPWLLRGPGLTPRVISERTFSTDVAPTIASLIDLPHPPDLDGRDRSELLLSPPE